MKKIFYIAGFLIVALTTTCKKPYNPIAVSADNSFLVVEGLINSGADSTIIHLSRTIKLDTYNANYATANPELKAVVTVEDDQNGTYTLKETPKGLYVSASLGLNASRKYRLRIKTADGLVYLSNYEAVKNSPPIDSLGFTATDKNLTVYVNTHDATGNSRYYRWEYEETWKFHTMYQSNYTRVTPPTPTMGAQALARTQSVYECFASDVSSNIILNSTTKLAQDVLFQAPITIIAPQSEKLGMRYSILVKQYVLSKEAYEFWSNIKKNTETLGSIFDSQPSAPIGNIQCVTNPGQPVIGYVSVGTVQRKRIFIDNGQLPHYVSVYPFSCSLNSYYFKDNSRVEGQIPVGLIIEAGSVVGFTASDPGCIDCTLRGTLAQPSFWK